MKDTKTLTADTTTSKKWNLMWLLAETWHGKPWWLMLAQWQEILRFLKKIFHLGSVAARTNTSRVIKKLIVCIIGLSG
jgi:hypothetical protein